MSGRHRAVKTAARKKRPSWRRPVALGGVAAAALVLSFWLLGGVWQNADTEDAALALTRPSTTERSTSPSKPSPSTTTKKTSTRPPTTKPPTASPEPSDTEAPPKPTKKATPKPAPPPPPVRECSTELEGTQPQVAQVGNHVLTKFDVDSVGGVGSRANASDHPSGLALDFMVDSTTGDALADYVLAHQEDFGVTYVIWSQQYNDGSGWSTMEDRGSATANHYDHVHVSFAAGAETSVTC